ncbi:MAG: SPOR domain-containing protein [Woeseiaceae bacterium]|jgi:cell division protein FtsN
MAKRKRKRSARAAKRPEYPGWVWMLFGLSIGLSVAFAVYVKDRGAGVLPDTRPQPASLQSALDDNDEALVPESAPDPKTNRFTFYDMLPNFEVVIPEEEANVTADNEPKAVIEPGLYVLQAGSFSAYSDADRRRAQLALQGIESTIQRVTIDDKTYHRVRIGPIDDLDKLNLLRSRLRAAQIDVLRIRLGD